MLHVKHIIIIIISNVLWSYLLRANFIHVQFVGQPQNFTCHQVLDCRQLTKSQRSLSALFLYQLLHARPQKFACYRSHGNKQQPDRSLKQNSPKCRSTALPLQKIYLEITSNVGGSPAVKANNEQR